MSSKAVVHVRTVRFRASEEIIGFRLEAAVPNQEGQVMRARHVGSEVSSFYSTGEPTTSFRRPYFVAESSDHQHIGSKEIESFKKQLNWNGFKEFEFVGKFDGELLADIAART